MTALPRLLQWLIPIFLALLLLLAAATALGRADTVDLEAVDVEGQPLAANAQRLLDALAFLGAKPSENVVKNLEAAVKARDSKKIQGVLDPLVLVQVTLNPESRVKARRGPAEARLQQFGFVPALIKVVNDSTVKKGLRISSLQAGKLYNEKNAEGRFLDAEMFTSPPMTGQLSGLKVEYRIALLSSTEAGKREATLAFDVGQGTQDLGFRAEVPILFDVRPATTVRLKVTDVDGQPTVGRFTFRDAQGHIYPPQAKRLAPDFFFQQQVYRPDGGTVLLPPGPLTMEYGRGPEYLVKSKKIVVPDKGELPVEVTLQRWITPREYGFYSGDHHIHAAGCQHYTSPTEGVFARDMFLHVKGEALNVGCNLTWGPCYEFQRQFFEDKPNKISEPFTVIKYDIEVSGFGSQALGHVCLLNLREQTYPGSDGTKTKGWPTWTTPLMRWAKQQGAVTGYAHSASGLEVNAAAAAKRLLTQFDADKDGKLSETEAAQGLLPEAFAAIDADKDGFLSEAELRASVVRAAKQLPNLAIPEMNGIGAQEICVTTAQKLCDFISAMDTARIPEWNCWYHLLNCGFLLKASGETDFPCISGSRVGQGRVYVYLGKVDHVDFGEWCNGVAKGRSYISDGYAHALDFRVNDKAPGYEDVHLVKPGSVTVKALVAFATDTPLGTSVGGALPAGLNRKVEIVVNGKAVTSQEVPADNHNHELIFTVPIDKSSWVALRQFPALHTNPVNVLVGDKPIRPSKASARWCIDVIEQLWRVRAKDIAESERDEAERTFKAAIETYKKIAAEAGGE